MRPLLALIVAALACVLTAPRVAAADATLFNLFLTDGTTMVVYGEYARLEDRVVFSMLMGGGADEPRLQTVTLPASLVDWERTERASASVRAQQYARTRGEADFARLSTDVADVLNEIVLTADRTRALDIAQRARATLADWPRQHYGYRQRDVQEIVGLLDEAISGLRASMGMTAFDVALVAPAPDLELVPPPQPPSLYDQVAQAFRVAGLTDMPSERIALLRGALLLLDEAGDTVPAGDREIWRRTADAQIREELALDERYTALARRLMSDATRAAADARVADVQRLLDRLPDEDQRLGGGRPAVVLALRASLEAQLAAARQLRLLRDQWSLRRAQYRDYQRMVDSYLVRLVRAEPALDAIRRLAGPAPGQLLELRARLRDGMERLDAMRPPAEAQATHDLLISAWRFAQSAVERRLSAAASADLSEAWEASSSAAGALLLLARTQQQIQSFLDPRPPQLP